MSKPQIECSNCGSVMESTGKQAIRMGDVDAASGLVTVMVLPDIGSPVQFDTYVCPRCGKVEFFADGTTRKQLKGEYWGDHLVRCPGCGKGYVKDCERCPYCGATAPRRRG